TLDNMVSLDLLTLEDTYRLAADLRELGASASSGDDASSRIVSHLFDQLRAAKSGDPACPLVRLFRTTSWRALHDEVKAALQLKLEREPAPDEAWLVLRASRGILEAWNDPNLSHAHHFLPISAPDTSPMVSALVAQLGLSAKAPFILR